MSLAVGAPVVTAGSVSKLSDILSQIRSTRRSKVCFTLMLSLALVSKNSKPSREEAQVTLEHEETGPNKITRLIFMI